MQLSLAHNAKVKTDMPEKKGAHAHIFLSYLLRRKPRTDRPYISYVHRIELTCMRRWLLFVMYRGTLGIICITLHCRLVSCRFYGFSVSSYSVNKLHS